MAFAEMKVDNAEERLEGNADQWSRLMAAGKSGGKRLQVKQSSPPDDLRVASFVRSKWSQSTATSGNGYSHNYYNYYVPNKYPCGCVATAFAQTMRYFEFPKTSVTPKTFTCKVGGYDFTNITCTVFNIFTNATQYSVIASGRVLDQGAVGFCLPDGRRAATCSRARS